jgi:hypothetical protein
MISATTVRNVGPDRVRLSRVRLESDKDGEQIRRFVTRWLAPHELETVRIPYSPSSRTKVVVHLVDLAGQDHVVIPEAADGTAPAG